MFDYKQRPFPKTLSADAYDKAVGRNSEKANPTPEPEPIIRNPLALNEDALGDND